MNSKIKNKIYIDISNQLQIKNYSKKPILSNSKKLHKKVILPEKTQIICKFQ